MWGLLPVLSVCLSAFALAWWLVCGWLAILSLACDLRMVSCAMTHSLALDTCSGLGQT